MAGFDTKYEFRDPIHGMIEINELEREIINTRVFQRLRNIKQLGTSYLVYHGAEHTRFGHSLGVLYLVDKAFEILMQKEPLKSKLSSPEKYKKAKYTLRLAALLHDIGHAPFSHVGEEKVYGLFPLLTDINGQMNSGHEVYTRLIIKEKLADLIDSYYEKTGVHTVDVLRLLIGDTEDKELRFLYDLINSQLDADKMDYLKRDSHYCGVNYGNYDLDKMLNALCICESSNGDWQLGISSEGVYAVEEFVYARYWMFLQVYFHKTRRIYDRYLAKFLKKEIGKYPENINKYLEYDDIEILKRIKEKRDDSDNIWARKLYYREHIKEAFVSPVPQLDDASLNRVGWVIEEFKKQFGYDDDNDDYYCDQAKGSTAKELIEITNYISESDEEEDSKYQLPAIPVKDKYTNHVGKIQDYSIPIKAISDKKINILRVYAKDEMINDVKNFCNEYYYKKYFDFKRNYDETRKKLEEMNKELENINKKYN